jgi:hypothetical protein
MSFYQCSLHGKMGGASYEQVLQISSDCKAVSREEGVKLNDKSNRQEPELNETKQKQNNKIVPSIKT